MAKKAAILARCDPGPSGPGAYCSLAAVEMGFQAYLSPPPPPDLEGVRAAPPGWDPGSADFCLAVPGSDLPEGGAFKMADLRGGGSGRGADAVRVGAGEAQSITRGGSPAPGDRLLLADWEGVVALVDGSRAYEVDVPGWRHSDEAGWVMSSVFCCTMVRERDPLWALCFAAGAAQAARPGKVPRRRSIQVNASYMYNLARFREL
ncbi:MAG: hypothetical protein MPI95_00295 [Nitrosopumilus sp.]|nr:hypothetical protein [Nitrosopumilus sp.]MDA7943223.1 hypothetical protein [Nitrosopumilus sp.]MDA7952382.1 hypothetical protein [Nitrosopumilus sp.]MDA7957520.1 hypothetical protein [Nitrosopumilus sp.]MDA7959618.1 hypothetical protein [Nitrosopumilus sp.]